MKNDYLYLQVAGFILKLNFICTEKNVNSFLLKEKLFYETSAAFSSFLLLQTPKKVDYFIDFITESNIEFVYSKKGKAYSYLYKIVSPNRIRTSMFLTIFHLKTVVGLAVHLLLNKTGGFMLHCSGVKVGDFAYIFTGRSGAGKSTTAKLLGGYYPILSDDTGIIKNEKNASYFYQGPFSEKGLWEKRYTSTPIKLGKIFFLRKSQSYKIENITNKNYIFERLIKQVTVVASGSKEVHQNTFKFVSSFNEFYFLHFGLNEEKLFDLIRKSL